MAFASRHYRFRAPRWPHRGRLGHGRRGGDFELATHAPAEVQNSRLLGEPRERRRAGCDRVEPRRKLPWNCPPGPCLRQPRRRHASVLQQVVQRATRSHLVNGIDRLSRLVANCLSSLASELRWLTWRFVRRFCEIPKIVVRRRRRARRAGSSRARISPHGVRLELETELRRRGGGTCARWNSRPRVGKSWPVGSAASFPRRAAPTQISPPCTELANLFTMARWPRHVLDDAVHLSGDFSRLPLALSVDLALGTRPAVTRLTGHQCAELLEQELAAFGQQHLLTFWDELTPTERESLAAEIGQIDFAELARLLAGQVVGDRLARACPPGRITASVSSRSRGRNSRPRLPALAAKRRSLRGQLGAILVAGGQGTRLGLAAPQGHVSHRAGFRLAAISDSSWKSCWPSGGDIGVRVPLYLMISPATHGETVAVSRRAAAFRTGRRRFAESFARRRCRRSMRPLADCCWNRPAVGAEPRRARRHVGRARLQWRDSTIWPAAACSICSICRSIIRWCVADPEFLGYHLLSGSEMSTQVVAKREPREKVGNVVSIDGRLQIIEYSDLPDEAAELRLPDGSLKIWAGNTAAHLFKAPILGASTAIRYFASLSRGPQESAAR